VTTTIAPQPPAWSDPPPTPRAPKPRNRVIGALGVAFSLLVVLWGCGTIVDLMGHTTSTIHRTLPAVSHVHLDLGGTGPVTIVAEPRNDTTIVRKVSQGLRETRVRETVTGGTLTLSSRCPRIMGTICNASYEVHVPSGVTVDGSSNGGAITLRGATDVHVLSDGGRIVLDRVTGPIYARTDGGRILGEGLRSSTVDVKTDGGRIDLGFLTAPEGVSARTGGGGIDIQLPPDAPSYRVDAHSDGGGVDVQIANDPRETRTITAHTGGGHVVLRYAS